MDSLNKNMKTWAAGLTDTEEASLKLADVISFGRGTWNGSSGRYCGRSGSSGGRTGGEGKIYENGKRQENAIH